jgi:hypothetical protein
MGDGPEGTDPSPRRLDAPALYSPISGSDGPPKDSPGEGSYGPIME